MAAEQVATAPWTAREDAVLDRLLDIGLGHLDDAKSAAVSLQDKLRGVGQVAALALGLTLNALAMLPGEARAPWTLALLGSGVATLAAALVVGTWAYQPLGQPGIGSLVRWRELVAAQGGTRAVAHLLKGVEDQMDLWQPTLQRVGRRVRAAQLLLAGGMAVVAIGVFVALAG